MVWRALFAWLALTAVASAEPPHGWVVRASPGFGYAWDPPDTCAVKGRMFVGGFAVEHEAANGVLIGPAVTILFNLLRADGPCGADDGLRLAMAAVMGPAVDWYPIADRGLDLFALGGYAELDPEDGGMSEPGRGLGATVGIGYEWRFRGKANVDLLFGLRAQVTAARTWSGPIDHAQLAPAIVATFGAD